MKKYLIYVLTALIVGGGAYGVYATVSAQQNATKQQASAIKTSPAQNSSAVAVVTPQELISNSQKYLNRNIKMNATFDKFSTLGLDYKPALRSSEEYIGILIRRDDVTDYVMPLPEIKIFLKRKVAEKYIDLETGDKICIEGKVFSTALSDAWVDVTKLTIISSKKPIKAS